MPIKIQTLFKSMVEKEASDMFLRTNSPPRARINGIVEVLDNQIVGRDEMLTIANFLLDNEERKAHFAANFDIDFIYADPAIGRFRVNIFKQRGTPSIVARHVHTKVRNFDQLHLPVEIFRQFCESSRGLVLLCGPAGSGKSTSIASMLEFINQNMQKHIVTIEDPIEFLFEDKKSIINQRELGLDVLTYSKALRSVTQQSPDIIYIGTCRDTDTMQAAMSAAELGALVLTTFHTTNAIQTIERVVNFFPPYLHTEIKMQLSLILKGVISLRLVRRKDGLGRIPAYETMVVTPTIARLIREGNTKDIQAFIDEGELFGMRSFKQTLVRLVNQGLVEEDEARKFSDSQDEFNLELKGIKRFAK